jgi:hypothetical protein
LGIGDKISGAFDRKIKSLDPEQLLKKFNLKDNADFIPFLAKHFPETLEQVRQNELLKIIKPAIKAALEPYLFLLNDINNTDSVMSSMTAVVTNFLTDIQARDAPKRCK